MLKILKELDHIKERLEGLEELPAVEKDLLLEKLRSLYLQGMQIKNGEKVPGDDPFELDDEKPAGEDEPARAEVPPPPREPAGQKAKTTSEKKEKPGKEIIADKFKGDNSYINERLAKKSEKEDLSSRLQSKPIEDISAALGINDKYQMIRDLFNGNPEIFAQTIEHLNHATNFNEAFNYINANFDWEMEDDSVKLLLDLVRRKFIMNDNG